MRVGLMPCADTCAASKALRTPSATLMNKSPSLRLNTLPWGMNLIHRYSLEDQQTQYRYYQQNKRLMRHLK